MKKLIPLLLFLSFANCETDFETGFETNQFIHPDEPSLASWPYTGDLNNSGPYGTYYWDDGTCQYWVPDDNALNSSGNLHPIITYGEGTGKEAYHRTQFLTHLASHGFVVAGSKDLSNGDGTTMRECRTRMQNFHSQGGHMLQGHVDVNRFCSVGFSQGGAGAIMTGADNGNDCTVLIHPFVYGPMPANQDDPYSVLWCFTQGGCFGGHWTGYDPGKETQQKGPTLMLTGMNDTVVWNPVTQNPAHIYDSMAGASDIMWAEHEYMGIDIAMLFHKAHPDLHPYKPVITAFLKNILQDYPYDDEHWYRGQSPVVRTNGDWDGDGPTVARGKYWANTDGSSQIATVALKAPAYNQWVRAHSSCGWTCADGGNVDSNGGAIGPWEQFDLFEHNDGRYSFRSHHGMFLRAAGGNVSNDRWTAHGAEKFWLMNNNNGTYTIKGEDSNHMQHTCGHNDLKTSPNNGGCEQFTVQFLSGGINNGGKWPQNFQNGSHYFIQSMKSGKFLDISGAGHNNGDNLHQWNYHGGSNQKVQAIDHGGGWFTLKFVHSNKCIDGNGGANNQNLYQWDCHMGNNQRFKALPQAGHLVNLQMNHYGRCIDQEGHTGDGGNVKLWDCSGSNINQLYRLVPAN